MHSVNQARSKWAFSRGFYDQSFPQSLVNSKAYNLYQSGNLGTNGIVGIDKTKVKKILRVVIIEDPTLPIHFPIKPPKIAPNKGKKIIDKEYIYIYI